MKVKQQLTNEITVTYKQTSMFASTTLASIGQNKQAIRTNQLAPVGGKKSSAPSIHYVTQLSIIRESRIPDGILLFHVLQ